MVGAQKIFAVILIMK